MDHPTTRDLLDRYLDAWKRRDVAAIVHLHHADGVFRLHTQGEQDARGTHEICARFTAIFAQWPDLAFESRRLHVARDWAVHELELIGTPAGPVAGIEPARAAGREPLRFDQVDVLEFRDGLVWRKDTYVDATAVLAALAPR